MTLRHVKDREVNVAVALLKKLAKRERDYAARRSAGQIVTAAWEESVGKMPIDNIFQVFALHNIMCDNPRKLGVVTDISAGPNNG